MAIQPKEVYRGRRKYRTVLAVLFSVVAILIAAAVVLFYSLQKYIVYDKDSLSLVLPFMTADAAGIGTDGGDAPPSGSDIVADLIIEEPNFDDVATDAGENLTELRAYFVPAGEVTAERLTLYASTIGDEEGDALVLEMKPVGGQLSWASDSRTAASFGTVGTEDLGDAIAALKAENVYLVAQLSCFADELMGTRNAPVALRYADGTPYIDSDGKYWLDPYNRSVRQYIIELMRELEGMGFDEVLLTDFRHPEQAEGIIYSQDMSAAMDIVSCISNNALKIKEAFTESELRISVMYDSAVFTGESVNSGQDAEFFFKVFDRLYCNPPAGGLEDISASLRTRMKSGDFSSRFVGFVSSAPEEGSWVIK